MRTIFEEPQGRSEGILPSLDVPEEGASRLLGEGLLRSVPARIPELSEPTLARHYARLARANYGVDDGMYPLGSCTMKYNPKIDEDLARLPGFTGLHPLADPELAQGALRLIYELSRLLAGIAGLPAVSLQPAAGAHGELTGMFIIKRHFEERGEGERRRILLPDSAHGTNPASAATAGFSVTEIPSDGEGMVDLAALKDALDHTVAGIMLTVPNTLGIFEERIIEITELVHRSGGLCY
ncbi:aminomethyl-transferring glycine dehydrogenase subunit GcvPB, partial [Candidatus Acetothermia bacterium]